MHVPRTVTALFALVVLAGASAPARADDGGILGNPQKVAASAAMVQRLYEQFSQGDLAGAEAAIAQSQTDILKQIAAVPATPVQACSATAVQQFANIDHMSADTLQAFAASSVACVNAAAADIGTETDMGAVDKAGFALNIAGPIALFASARANERTDIVSQSLIAADQKVVQQLKPWCRISILSPDNLPWVGSGGVTGHAGCLNYHVKPPGLVVGNVVYFNGPPPNTGFDPWSVRGLAQQIDWLLPNRGYDVFYPGSTDFSIASDAVLSVTSSPIADAALYALQPAIGRWGSPIALGAAPSSPVEALRVDAGGGVSRNEIHNTDDALSGWTAMGGRLKSIAEASNADGRLEMFGTDKLGRVFHRWQQTAGDDTSWSPWAQLAGQTISSLAVAPDPDGTLLLIGTDPAGRIFTRHQIMGGDQLPEVRIGHIVPAIDAWTDWRALDGTLTQIAAGVNANGEVELFGVNAAGQVWDRRQTDAAAGTWAAWHLLDGTLKTIAVASDLGGSLNVFGTDINGTVWQRFQQGQNTESWSGWTSLGGARMWNVAAAKESFGGGRIDLLGLDSRGNLWLNSADGIHGDTWRGWTAVPDAPASPPAVATPGNQRTPLGTPVDLVLSVSGGTAPYALSVTGLPPGLSAGGVHITGTPVTAGTYTVSVTPADAVGTPGAATTFTWAITGVTVPDLRGESMADARHDIAALGLVASVGTRKACTDPGAVIEQNPGGGAIVQPGSTVRVTVDSGTPSSCRLG